MRPEEIEALSFEIIDKEAGEHGFEKRQWNIIRRMIHTSADFDYLQTVRIHDKAIEAGIEAITRGKNIITDTKMARDGISKNKILAFKAEVKCLIDNEEVKRLALNSENTRAKLAVDQALDLMQGGIYVIGNAPTALLRLMELVREGKAKPGLIIGLPVGFVNAAESKQALTEMDYPFITNVGRRGGSNVAASVVNALAILAGSK